MGKSTACTYSLSTPSFHSIVYYDQNNVTTMASCRLQSELIMPSDLHYHVKKTYKIPVFTLEIRKLLFKTSDQKWDQTNFTYAKSRLNYKTDTFTLLFINADIGFRGFVHNIRHALKLGHQMTMFCCFLGVVRRG